MKHDKWHCKGTGCPAKGGCLRYLLEQTKAADGVQYATYVDAEECQIHDYHFYTEYEG